MAVQRTLPLPRIVIGIPLEQRHLDRGGYRIATGTACTVEECHSIHGNKRSCGNSLTFYVSTILGFPGNDWAQEH